MNALKQKTENQLAINDEDDKQTEPVVQFVSFHLGEELYGVNVIQVQEILRMTEITPVPGAAHYVKGIINLRGNIVTVIDLRQQLQMSEKEFTDLTRVIILEGEKYTVGYIVDSVAGVIDLAPSQIEKSPNASRTDGKQHITGVTTQNGELLILLNVEYMLNDSDYSSAVGF
ncbi:MAG: chemotaxis protein CheW [Gammaproteobacteria bacterium]